MYDVKMIDGSLDWIQTINDWVGSARLKCTGETPIPNIDCPDAGIDAPERGLAVSIFDIDGVLDEAFTDDAVSASRLKTSSLAIPPTWQRALSRSAFISGL